VKRPKGVAKGDGTYEPYEQIMGKERETLGKTLARRYRSGQSIRTIAASIGRSYGFVHIVLRVHHVELRPRGGYNRPRQRPAEEAQTTTPEPLVARRRRTA